MSITGYSRGRGADLSYPIPNEFDILEIARSFMISEGRIVQEDVRPVGQSALQPGDIIFECPQCGKSLAIDVRGAGYIVRCPDCQTEIQVPGADANAAGNGGAAEVAPPTRADSPDALIAEIQRLKHQQTLDAERNRRISAELALIQAAIDRIVGLIEETQPSENS